MGDEPVCCPCFETAAAQPPQHEAELYQTGNALRPMNQRWPNGSTKCVVGDFAASVEERRAALALNPNSAFVISTLGLMPGRAGHHQEAIDRLRKGAARQPERSVDLAVAQRHRRLPALPRAVRARAEGYRLVISRRPQFFSPHLYAAACLAYLGRAREARVALASAQVQFGEQIARRRDPGRRGRGRRIGRSRRWG